VLRALSPPAVAVPSSRACGGYTRPELHVMPEYLDDGMKMLTGRFLPEEVYSRNSTGGMQLIARWLPFLRFSVSGHRNEQASGISAHVHESENQKGNMWGSARGAILASDVPDAEVYDGTRL
jgi:hypothetical protein